MTKFFRYICPVLAIICILSSCKEDESEKIILSDSVRISAFSLEADTLVLRNLENVFFTIDLEKGLIYNADSLPLGTDVSALAVDITTEDAASVNITTADDTFDYLEDTDKTIDFTTPVQIEVVSKSGLHKKQYEVSVNVHKVEADRLYWGNMQYSGMPGEGTLSKQYTLRFNDLLHCYMKRGDEYLLATASTPGEQWEITQLSFSFEPRLQTMRCSDTALFMLDEADNLYTSTDGVTWENTGMKYAAIIGNHNDAMLMLTQENGIYYHDVYPRPDGYTPQPTATDFPVSGFSEMLTYNSSWLAAPQGMIVGGRTADGSLTGAMWGFDGTTWAVLNNTIPQREGAAFFQYITFYVDDYWITTEKTTWFIIGGINDNAALSDVWVSNNYGVTWEKADMDLQMPGYIAARGFASVVICDEPLHTKSGDWKTFDMLPIPQGYRSVPMYSANNPTLVPYIYMFGGENFNGSSFNQIWRGVINRLKFEPIP